MKSNVNDMTKGNPFGLILAFMVPLLIGNLFQQFYNMVDSAIVGRIVGANGLAAVGATGSVNFLFFSLCGGMSNGGGIVTAQCFGERNESRVKQAITNSSYIMVTVSVLMAFVGYVCARPLLTFLDTPEDIIGDAVLYLQVSCIGVPAVGIYNHISAILRALGDSKTPLYFLILASGLNIVLDLLFVGPMHMGVAGAALATIIAQTASGVLCVVYAFAKNPYFKFARNHFTPNKVQLKRILKLGSTMAVQWSLIAVSCVVVQGVVNGFGSTVVAAFTVNSRLEQLVQQPYNALGGAMSTFAGQNFGAGQINRIKDGMKKGLLIMVGYSVIMLPLIYFGAPLFAGIFTEEADVIAMATRAMRITGWFFVFLGTISVVRSTLNGIGDVLFPFINGVVEVAGRVCIPKPMTMHPLLGVWGIWFANGLVWFVSAASCVIRYGYWMHKYGRKFSRNTLQE